MTNLLVNEGSIGIGIFINIQRFSLLSRLYQLTMYVLKFMKWLKGGLPSDEETLVEAERLWLIDCQSLLTSHPRYRLWKLQFGLFCDDNGLEEGWRMPIYLITQGSPNY